MAAVAPAATMARHKLRSLLPSKKADINPADHIEDMHRWSPVTTSAPSADQAAK
jgi:hypothetical protein